MLGNTACKHLVFTPLSIDQYFPASICIFANWPVFSYQLITNQCWPALSNSQKTFFSDANKHCLISECSREHLNPNHSFIQTQTILNLILVVVSLASGVKTSLQISLKTGKKAEKRWSMCPNLDFTLGDYERCVMATFSRSSDMLIIARSKNFVSHVSDLLQNILPFCVSFW